MTFYIPTRYSAGEARALLNDDHVGLATSLVGATTNHVRAATCFVVPTTKAVASRTKAKIGAE